MFKNKGAGGRLNICGIQIGYLRKQMKISQRELAERLQLLGLDLSKNAIQKIESGERFVTDIEVRAFASVFDVASDRLLG